MIPSKNVDNPKNEESPKDEVQPKKKQPENEDNPKNEQVDGPLINIFSTLPLEIKDHFYN